MERKPNFIVMGVPKAGTTSLYHYLKDHPDIYLPETTELRYFNRDEMLANLNGPGDEDTRPAICDTWQKYLSFFSEASGESAIGEVTTSYLYTPETVERITSGLGQETRLIVILRDPVERTYSNYLYYRRRGLEKCSFSSALQREKSRMKKGWNNPWFSKHHSLYAQNIEHLIKSGLPYQILLFEDLAADPVACVQDVYRFLGVDDTYVPKNAGIIYNKGGNYTYQSVIQWMQQPDPARTRMKNMLPAAVTGSLRRYRDRFISRNTVKPAMDPGIRAELREYFREDVRKLGNLIPLDLSKWGYEM